MTDHDAFLEVSEVLYAAVKDTIAEVHHFREAMRPVAAMESIELLSMKLAVMNGEMRGLERRNRKLEERLNRIAKLVPGRQRIWELDRLAMEHGVDADLIDQSCTDNLASRNEDDIWSSDERAAKHEQMRQFRADALFLRRFEWDLGKLRDVVRGDERSPSAKYDPTMWKGDRP